MIDTVICGDCLEVMRGMEDNCIDSIITDPPYGLSFMGKGWDHGVPGVPYWSECLRVAKPGAILMAFGGTRTFHRLTCAIEDAGWEIRDCMMWLYGSGFPKSLDISKAIDKAAGVEREDLGPHPTIGGKGDHFAFCANYDGARITAPATPLAQQWDGWGTALKPSWEPIIVAMKPLDGTFAQNAEKWGVVGLWIDGGRIGDDVHEVGMKGRKSDFWAIAKNNQQNKTVCGRFPANLILDEEAAAMLDEQSGINTSGKVNQSKQKYAGDSITPFLRGNSNASNQHGDSGGASRFFYCAKSSRSERNAGCEGMEAKDAFGQYTASGTNKGGKCQPRENFHPTVKPLALMEYLCKLTKTPTGGIVLDPFAGSGSTGIAAYKTGRQYILIDKDPDYCKIAEKRIQEELNKYALFETDPKRSP